MAKIAVVILNWNGINLLKKFLPHLIQYTPNNDIELFVADNASTDGSVNFIKENYSQIKIILLDKNYGFAEGYNRALKQIDAEYFILLNSDVEVSEGWIFPLIKSLTDDADVVAVQPKILSQKDKLYFEYAGACGGFIDKYGYPFCRGRIFSFTERDNGQYQSTINVFWVSGACFAVRADIFFQAGGFDISFFAHMEEIDLCWRFNSMGKKLICNPQSIVYHVGGATLNSESPQKTYLNFRNNLLMLYKNLESNTFGKIYKRRQLLDTLSLITFISKGKISNATAILKAHREFNRIKETFKSMQENNLNNALNSNIKTIYPSCIVIDYYLHSKRVFSALKKWNNK